MSGSGVSVACGRADFFLDGWTRGVVAALVFLHGLDGVGGDDDDEI